jgi:hypothetical protein
MRIRKIDCVAGCRRMVEHSLVSDAIAISITLCNPSLRANDGAASGVKIAAIAQSCRLRQLHFAEGHEHERRPRRPAVSTIRAAHHEG